MDIHVWKTQWQREETLAQIHGWDFSHLAGRYEEEELPWDYGTVVRGVLRPYHRLLDMDTGGGEFLLSLGHEPALTSATEAYGPNVSLCRQVLVPLGIDLREADSSGALPFENDCFDLVLNRHGSYVPEEVFRVLKPGGVFLTQQVGEDNDRELVERLLPGTPKPFPGHNLTEEVKRFRNAGFFIELAEEAFGAIRFFDVGALVWFARVIAWDFPGFCVESCFDRLLEVERIRQETGCVEGRIHRFLLKAVKMP